MQLPDMSATEMAQGLITGSLTALDIATDCIRRIESSQQVINAFVEVHLSEALDEARRSDERIQASDPRSPIDGIPVGVKDIIGVRGHNMRAGSAAFDEHVEADAAVVRRLRAAGAVIIGRTRLHELAFGASGLNDFDGGARNPKHPSRLTGGSSSGSAAAVAAALCPIALGTDTGGSVRVPAALCGVVGYKPTHSLLPTDGVLPLSPTLDHVGVVARTVSDVQLVMGSISDPAFFGEQSAVTPRTVGVLQGSAKDVDAIVGEGFEHALRRLSKRRWNIQYVQLPAGFDVIELTTTIMSYEAYQVHGGRLASTPHLIGSDVRDRLKYGASISAGNYQKALASRRKLRSAMKNRLAGYDAVLSATVPMPPPLLEEGTKPDVRRRLVQNTRLHNLLGTPAISVPFLYGSLPIGIQFLGQWDDDVRLLMLAASASRSFLDV